MDGEPNSWLTRANFSHTVCHRLDSSRLRTAPFTVPSEFNSGLKSRPGNSNLRRSPTTNRQRSTSPLPEITLSDAFKEARSDRKRFSTPRSREEEHEKIVKGRIFRDDRRNSSPSRHPASSKVVRNSKFPRDSSWMKFFDHKGGKVSSGESVDEWSLDLLKLFIGSRFAHGAHSMLYHGMYNDEPVAIKIIRSPEDDDNGALAGQLESEFSREVTLLSHLHHPNVIKFVAASRNPPVYCVVTKYVPGGSLRAYLHKLEGKPLPLRKLIAIALDIGRGMEYVHSLDVIHRDLKPENILIDQDFKMVIADFGIACREANGECLTYAPGTYRWMAPEMIKHKRYGRKVDVYSFGLILWEMVAGTIPYEDMNPIQAAFAVVNKNLRPTFRSYCPPALRALIEQCWSVQPEKRPEFREVVKVLEQFESSISMDGSLDLPPNPSIEDHKKGPLHWIHKLGPLHSHTLPKPKFS